MTAPTRQEVLAWLQSLDAQTIQLVRCQTGAASKARIAASKGYDRQLVINRASRTDDPTDGRRLFVMDGVTNGGHGVVMQFDLPFGADDIADGAITAAKINSNALGDGLTKSGGKIVVDVASGGGLGFDQDGNLFVDASAFSGDLLAQFLAAIHVPIWIGENGVGRDFYVDPTHSAAADRFDSTEIGGVTVYRGNNPAFPFKTVRYAIRAINTYYNISTYDVRVFIKGGTYAEQVDLGQQSGSTGTIRLYPYENETVNFTRTGYNNYIFNCTGGRYYLYNLNFAYALDNSADDTATPKYTGIIRAQEGRVNAYNCNYAMTDSTISGTAPIRAAVFTASSGGIVSIYGSNTITTSYNIADRLDVCYVSGGTISWGGSNSSQAEAITTVSGSATRFIYATYGGVVEGGGGSLYDHWLTDNSFSAKKYQLSGGSHTIALLSDGSQTIPGDTAGTLEAASYCYAT